MGRPKRPAHPAVKMVAFAGQTTKSPERILKPTVPTTTPPSTSRRVAIVLSKTSTPRSLTRRARTFFRSGASISTRKLPFEWTLWTLYRPASSLGNLTPQLSSSFRTSKLLSASTRQRSALRTPSQAMVIDSTYSSGVETPGTATTFRASIPMAMAPLRLRHAFSITTTLSPGFASFALMAAMHPALPPPMTKTSASTTLSGNSRTSMIETLKNRMSL